MSTNPKPTDEQARRARALSLREQIERLRSKTEAVDSDAESAEMRPGESPRAYVERRSKQLARVKRADPRRNFHTAARTTGA